MNSFVCSPNIAWSFLLFNVLNGNSLKNNKKEQKKPPKFKIQACVSLAESTLLQICQPKPEQALCLFSAWNVICCPCTWKRLLPRSNFTLSLWHWVIAQNLELLWAFLFVCLWFGFDLDVFFSFRAQLPHKLSEITESQNFRAWKGFSEIINSNLPAIGRDATQPDLVAQGLIQH